MKDLVERFGSPLYVYRLAEVRAAAAELRRALPAPARIYYSLKANPHPAIVGELVRSGLASEVSSTDELSAALAAGQRPDDCLLTGPGKTDAEVADALTRGVRTFSVESETDYLRLERVARRLSVAVEVLLRLNTARSAGRGTGLRMTGVATQFGMPPEVALDLFHRSGPTGQLRVVGLHLFPATNVPEADDLMAEFTLSIESSAALLKAAGATGRLVDIGGGFAAPFARPGTRPDYRVLRERLGGVLDERLPGWREGEPRIAFESGRFLTSGCGSLVATVLDVKTSGGTTYVVLDAGVNALGGMSGLGRILAPDVQPEAVGRSVPEAAATGGGQRISLVGSLCTPLDVLSRSASISMPVVGDVITIPNVGAYGLSASLLGFLSKPVPAEVVLSEDGSVVAARRVELCARELPAGA